MKRLMARMKSMAESPQAKAIGQKLAQKARDPATRTKLSDGVRKLRRRKS